MLSIIEPAKLYWHKNHMMEIANQTTVMFEGHECAWGLEKQVSWGRVCAVVLIVLDPSIIITWMAMCRFPYGPRNTNYYCYYPWSSFSAFLYLCLHPYFIQIGCLTWPCFMLCLLNFPACQDWPSWGDSFVSYYRPLIVSYTLLFSYSPIFWYGFSSSAPCPLVLFHFILSTFGPILLFIIHHRMWVFVFTFHSKVGWDWNLLSPLCAWL